MSSASRPDDLATGLSDDWCLIESDPAVFTELIESFGCVNTIEFMELYSIDSDSSIVESLQLLPQLPLSLVDVSSAFGPLGTNLDELLELSCYGLIFLFEYKSAVQKQHGESATTTADATDSANTESLGNDDSSVSPHIFFAQQITTNACATQAVLSVIMNAIHEGTLSLHQIGDMLSEFYQFTHDLPPYYKGMAINSSEVLRNAHNSFTATNDTFLSMSERKERNTSEKGEAFHFVAYVPVNGIVYELDGLQNQPIIVGTIGDAAMPEQTEVDDMEIPIPKKYLWLSIARRAIQERMQMIGADAGAVKFNLMAVTGDRRAALRSLTEQCHSLLTSGDDSHQTVLQLLLSTAAEELHVQDTKRMQYKLENQRRKHNYLGLIMQLLKELARMNKLRPSIDAAKEKQAQKKRKLN
jgi:ubiquitin carboxyl-terminal hydrolase L5